MCVNLTQYPLVELEDGKKKVLFNYGYVVENRDSQPIEYLMDSWRYAIKNKKNPSVFIDKYLTAVRLYDIKNILKYTCVPCGKCEECLKSKARGWAFRILKEAEQYDNNYFITFTYDDEHLPHKPIFNLKTGEYYGEQSTLIKDEISKFNKSLKKKLHDLGLDPKFRFYGVGEYGDTTYRAHYHVIYFNLDLPLDDLVFYKIDNGNILFNSKILSNVWKKGHVVVGALDIGSACYVARYCDKKLNRTNKQKVVFSDFDLQPEFSVMSRRPGIGAYYLDALLNNFKNEVFKISMCGNDFSIPIYYNKKIKNILTTEQLEFYESRNKNLIYSKFNRDLLLNDIMQTDLQEFYKLEDFRKKSCKRLRDNIKF